MRAKNVLIAAIVAVMLAVLTVLFVPYQTNALDDGGTTEYRALTYRVVKWKHITGDGIYEKTRVYFFGDLSKSIDELWEREEPNVEHRFVATVVEMTANTVLVKPMEYEWEYICSNRISFDASKLTDIGAAVGSVVQVTYRGAIRETHPAGIDVTGWEITKDMRHMEYTGKWLDQETAKSIPAYSQEFIITSIYSDCFFAKSTRPIFQEYKINGTISGQWCVGDRVNVSFDSLFKDENGHIEGDMKSIKPCAPSQGGELTYDKPVIYLYPEEETEVTVRLALDGRLTCTYPAYAEGWTVTAQPDGTLTDVKGQTYNYLYWEGETNTQYDLSKGFCVKGQDTAAFLENALAKLGLNRREANEFIVYWLPLMEDNPYNIISFQTDAYTDAAQLEVDPAPDTLIRVFMAWRASEAFVELPEPELTAPRRTGFTMVEWGGTEIQ